MKITGTKKLFIIFFALLCALAAGLGVIITRSGVSVRASDSAHTEMQAVPPDVSENLKEDISVDETAESEAVDSKLAEEEYDERFDEDAIREIAEIWGTKYELMNLYCHLEDINASELLAAVREDQVQASKNEENSIVEYDAAKDGKLTEEDAEELERKKRGTVLQAAAVHADFLRFHADYANCEVEVSEEDAEHDWFVSPDEVSTFASWRIYNMNYNGTNSVGIYVENLNGTSASNQWENITSQVNQRGNIRVPDTVDNTILGNADTSLGYYTTTGTVYVTAYNAYNGVNCTSNATNFYCDKGLQGGLYYVANLAPGQRLRMTYSTPGNSTYWNYGNYGSPNAYTHFQSLRWYGGSGVNLGSTSEIIVDGDAPDGSIFYIGQGAPNLNTNSNSWYNRYSWYNYSGVTSSTSITYMHRSSLTCTWWIEIRRENPPKPELVQDDTNVVNGLPKYTATSKEAYFYGTPVQLAVNPDYGVASLKWSAYTNISCTSPDNSVELFSRSQHGVEPTYANGFEAADLIVQSGAKGTHYIKLESATGKWADGSTAPVVFSLTVKEQYTDRPNIKGESGVVGKEKTVNYTGGYLTITFENCDPNYVGYTAPGMELDETQPWTHDNKTLTLRQKEQGTYSISLYLKNPSGCFWKTAQGQSTGNDNSPLTGFKLHIKEMLIDKPTVPTGGWPKGSTHTGNECEVNYDTTTKYLKISPARQEQLVIVAAGLKFNFYDEDDDGIEETCVFEMTDSGTQTITVMPDTGYLWKDKSRTAITYKFTIKAVPLDFPELAPGQGQQGNAITVDFNPDPGWSAKLVINKIPKDAIAVSTALFTDGWDYSDKTKPQDELIDHDYDIVTLYASEANKYVVTFALTTTNYRWKNSGSSPPTFTLTILPYKLEIPKINETLPDGYTGGYIEGDTKTIYYNTDESIKQLVTPESDRFFKLFVGGFTDFHAGFGSNQGQITIKYTRSEVVSSRGLNEDWTHEGESYKTSTANLTLWAYEAGNYIIDIVPTHNYRWTDGTNDMYTFKFVVTPIYHDTLSLFVRDGSGAELVPVGKRDAQVTYNAEEKSFRIGSVNIATEYYIPAGDNEEGMSFTLVDEDHKEIGWPDGFSIAVVNHGQDDSGATITVLEGHMVNAGTYIIKVSLNSVNYAWRDGASESNRDVYYTIEVKPQPIGRPEINEHECNGGQELSVKVDLDYISAGYNGNDITMTVDIPCDGLELDKIIAIEYNRYGNDEDPDTGYGIWQVSWESLENINRLVFRAKNVGTHPVVIIANDPNYTWDGGRKEILFSIEIAYARVDDVTFYYSANDEALSYAGGNNAMANESYDFNVKHHITVARSGNDFVNTDFEEMFTFEITYSNPDPAYILKDSGYKYVEALGKSDKGEAISNCLVLDFVDANVYYINIYLTKNYRWKSVQQIGAAMSMTFTVRPKLVSIPVIVDEGEKNDDGSAAATISGRDKTVTYATGKFQSIAINYGDDYLAYEVDDALTSSYATFIKDVSNERYVRYTGVSAGTYYVYITLSDTNNYVWTGGVNVEYKLIILLRSVSLPDAFYTFWGRSDGGIESAGYDYADVKSGSRGTPIVADLSGEYKTVHDYTGQLQYVFLFGYAVENQEVEISVTAQNTAVMPDQGGYANSFFSAGGVVRGHYVYAQYVNEYTVTVEFILNDEFGTPNCHWSGVPSGADMLPRIFILEIEKLGVEVPVIAESVNAENPSVPVFDAAAPNGPDKVEWHFTYTGKTGDIVLHLDKCLSSYPVVYMDYTDYDGGLLDAPSLDEANKRLTLRIKGKAEVGVIYRLAVKLDYKNEYWKNSGVPDDINDKEIYIVIDKLGVTAPSILNEGDGYTGVYPAPGLECIPNGAPIYAANTKTYTYDASKNRQNAMTITDIADGAVQTVDGKVQIIDGKLQYSLKGQGTQASAGAGNNICVGTTESSSGTYSIVFTLTDTKNLKWAGTANDSGELEFSLIIDPVRKPKPVIDQLSCVYNPLDATAAAAGGNAVFDLSDPANPKMTVTFYKDADNHGVDQYIVIKNYIKNDLIMNYSRTGNLKGGETVLGGGSVINALSFGNSNAGEYAIKITPTANVAWDDGTSGEILFTLKINKLTYADPTINGSSIVTTTEGYKKTVTYVLDTWQSFVVNGYDQTLMRITETTSSNPESLLDGMIKMVKNGEGDGVYGFEAKQTGTYTVKFSLVQHNNERFAFADNESIVFTFVIEKLKLAKPVFDNDVDIRIEDEAVNAARDTFTASYDAEYHGALVLNVLGEGYMKYAVPEGADYNGAFGYEYAPTATTELTPAPSPTYMTINDVFNKTEQTKFSTSSFQNGLIGLSNQIVKENFILLDAKETGEYKLVFVLANGNGMNNLEWADGTDGAVTVTFKITKKKLNTPNYNGTSTLAYTGQPVEFELKDIYNLNADAFTPATYTGLELELFEVISTPSAKAEITAASLDTVSNILKISATEIGTYEIRIKIKEPEHTEWTTAALTEKTFTFIITKGGITPAIEFLDPLLADGSPDTGTATNFAAGTFEWPKSTSVTAKITFPKLSVNGTGYIDINNTLGFDIYYVNFAAAAERLCPVTVTPSAEAADLFAAAAPTAAGTYVSANDAKWSLVVTDLNPSGTPELQYDLVYVFTVVPDPQKHPEDDNNVRYIPMGTYSMHVDQAGESTTYAVGSVNKNFDVLADRAPFGEQNIFDNIVWQRYLVSDPDTVVETYSVGSGGNLYYSDGVTHIDHWADMTATEAVELDFRSEDNDLYGFRLGLDAAGMNGKTDVQLALQSWEVNWDGSYGGSPTAKYAGTYQVSVIITAKDPKAFSFGPETYTFHYKILKILYDLDGLDWYYTDAAGNDAVYPNDGTTPYTYDGKAHSVKLDAPASVWNKLPGLTVLYDVDDLNSQVNAKYDGANPADDTKNYKTTVRFVTSNPNYQVPLAPDIQNGVPNTDTYKVNGVSGVAFGNWSLVWGIERATVRDGWVAPRSSDGSTTISVPKLYDNDGKVDYTYYLDDGTGTEITEFGFLTATPVNFYVVATLKSDPAHPEIDYASNYVLVVDGTVSNPAVTAYASDQMSVGGNAITNAKRFQLSANGNISVTVKVEIYNPADPTQPLSVTLNGSNIDTVPTGNVLYYDGGKTAKFEPKVTVDAPYTGIITVIDEAANPNGNLRVTYYNVNNTLRPISAPTEPGRYLVKVELVNFPDDGTDYGLAETTFYFDVKKGNFDEDSIYWQYTHVDEKGNTVYAKFDFAQGANGLWIISKVTDINGDDVSATQTDYVIGAQIEFTYDGRDHNVRLVGEDSDNLKITMQNEARINAGKYLQIDNTAAIAKLSFNGKLWENPTFVVPLMEWEIKKAVIHLSTNWINADETAYNPADYVYTLSGGKEVKYGVILDSVPELLKTFATYKTYNLDKLDAEGKPTLLNGNTFAGVGNYRTEFSCEDFLTDEGLKANYELGNPADAKQFKDWSVAVREIALPYGNGSWTAFDGGSHDLISSVSILAEWEEYLSVAFEYDNGAGFAAYDGTGEFGNARFASHAGDYKFIFSVSEGINTADKDDPTKTVINVVFNLGGTVTTVADQSVIITVAKAVMYGGTWNDNGEASTVNLTGATYTSYDVIDYRFTLPDGTTDVEIAEVAASSNKSFIVWAYVRDEFAGDVELFTSSGDSSAPHWSITTAPQSGNVSDQIEVEKIPYIAGYKENGREHTFTYEEWQKMMLETPGFFTDEQKAAIEDGTFDWVPYLGYESAEAEQAAYDALTDEQKADYEALSDEAKAQLKKDAAIRIAVYKSKTRVNLTYDGNTIEFVINNWSYYSQYLDIWQGNLVRSEAGDYSVTLVFKKTSPAPAFCWGYKDNAPSDGVVDEVDRSPVELAFRISFRMLSVPVIKDPTYTGSEINVLTSSLGDDAFDEWWSECKEYVDIEGATGTLAGGYTLKLKIKDLYLNTIHWDNGNAKGQPGTYVIKWSVLPIYIAIPTFETGKKLTYNGSAHSVFELFNGYNNGELSKELQSLMQLANISGERGINAGSYEARFVLPDVNYAWRTDTGDVDDSALIQFPWSIQRKTLDMSKLEWNYDEKNPFQYTVDGGEIQPHTIELKGLPEELEDLVTYLTDGVIGNEKSLMGTYNTVVYFAQGSVDISNYELGNEPAEFIAKYKDPDGNGYLAITWEIVERRFNIPEEKTVVPFDGTVREILSLFGIEEGWDNYLEIKVEYKPLGAADSEYITYADMATGDALLSYSPFNVFYLGDYRIEFTIKSGLNDRTTCVVWMDGGNKLTGKQASVLTVNPLELNITGWTLDGDGKNYVIKSSEYDKLSDESKDVFEYIIRDEATGEVVTMDDVVARGAGIEYTIEFAIKEGNDYAVSKGIIIGVHGTTNPYGFNSLDFVGFPGDPNAQSSVIYWLPIPGKLQPAKVTFNGADRQWQIDGWNNYLFDSVYPDFVSDMQTNHGVDVGGYVSFIIPDAAYKSNVNTNDGIVTLKAAGKYDIVMRLLPNVNLSWYDPDLYTFNGTNLYAKSAPSTAITGTALEALIDRKAKKLEAEIEKASVDRITEDQLESLKLMIPLLEYTGKEYDLTLLPETKPLFDKLKAKYGDLITFENYKGTGAGNYRLLIKLTDPDSSFWNLLETETVRVNVKEYADYDASYEIRYVNGVAKYVNAAGKEYNDGNYKLSIEFKMVKAIGSYVDMTGLLDENGMPETESGAKYVVDESGRAVRYKIVDENYVVDAEGTVIAKYSLNPDGSIVEKPEMVDGKAVIDNEKSAVTVTRIKTSTDPYEIEWTISSSSKAAPTVDPDVKVTFNGSEQFAEKALIGFDANVMEIVEGGSGINVGEYTAKIAIKDTNYKWRDGIADEYGYVNVTWKIEKTSVDLSYVTWKFTDGTTDYADGKGMIYTRRDGKPVVYWAELDNLPEAVKGSIRYTTNGTVGAYAGVNAGKYVTSFEIVDPYGNFDTIILPETLAISVTWNIQRRLLGIPSVDTTYMIFDDEPHDLLAMLNVQDDWAEYYTITVMYAKNFTAFDAYLDSDGNPLFVAYGAGAYRFIFNIRSGINPVCTNGDHGCGLGKTCHVLACVGWLKSSGEIVVPVKPDEANEGVETVVEQTYASAKQEKQRPAAAAESVAEIKPVGAAEAAEGAATKTAAQATVAQQIYDRIKRLTYGAQIQLHSFRKYPG